MGLVGGGKKGAGAESREQREKLSRGERMLSARTFVENFCVELALALIKWSSELAQVGGAGRWMVYMVGSLGLGLGLVSDLLRAMRLAGFLCTRLKIVDARAPRFRCHRRMGWMMGDGCSWFGIYFIRYRLCLRSFDSPYTQHWSFATDLNSDAGREGA